MAGLQRSAQTFRRSGSSGLVWDERFLTEAAGVTGAGAEAGRRQQQPELRHSRSVGSVAGAMLRRGGTGEADRDDDKKRKVVMAKPNHKDHDNQKQQQRQELVVNGRKAFRTRDVAPAAEPPSPRVPAGCCAPCAIFRDAAGAGAGASASSLPRWAKKR